VVNYLKNHSFPAYQPEAIQYFPEVSRGVPDMLKAIDAAKTYIFFESFIIKEGEMWSRLLEVLEKKAKEGVEVRLAYDAYGCINLPLGFSQKLREKGIKCRAINKIPLLLNFNINNRSHVKLTIVDGEVAFVMEGNIGDEYINKTQPYGHWKDGIMMLRGAPVNSIVAIFLKLWHFGEDLDTEQIFENEKYFKKPEKPASMAPSDNNSSGLVVPFYCWPSAAEPIYENVYLQLLNSAKKEVVFVAPYYIPSDRFLDACVMVAKKGISVSLITPATYNSVGAKLLTRRFFPQLLAAGVNIYEYTPGFIHCKSMLVDSVCGVFGTANMDYRSFYSAFEAGVVLANPEAVAQLAADYTHTIQQSHKVTIEDCTSGPLIVVGTMLLTLIIAVF
jgi:cardiolipin synthase